MSTSLFHPTPTTPPASSSKSVAFWAKVATSTTAQNVMDLNGAGTNIRIVSGVVTANGFTSPTIYVDGAVTSTLNNTNWHHVVITTGTNVNASNVNLGVASSTYFGGTLDEPMGLTSATDCANAPLDCCLLPIASLLDKQGACRRPADVPQYHLPSSEAFLPARQLIH